MNASDFDMQAVEALVVDGEDAVVSTYAGRKWTARRSSSHIKSGYTASFVVCEQLSDTKYRVVGVAQTRPQIHDLICKSARD